MYALNIRILGLAISFTGFLDFADHPVFWNEHIVLETGFVYPQVSRYRVHTQFHTLETDYAQSLNNH